ncbi:MAG: EamA family transporter [Rhizobiales bacterium]|nr:EamA family transporter [Hyphomicrobiales bacterium]
MARRTDGGVAACDLPAMQPDIFIAIIACAALHALWNSFLKIKADPAVATTMLAVGGGIAGTGLLCFTGMPDPRALPFLALSVVIHLFYWTSLGKAYAAGDVCRVYPLARGAAPVITTLLAIPLFGEFPSAHAWAGIATVTAGVFLIAIKRDAGTVELNRDTLKFAAMVAVTIPAYSLVDGYGGRLAGSGFAYTAFLYVCNGWALLAYGLVKQRAALIETLDRNWHLGLFTGSLSLLSYAVAIWAMSHAPIGLVAALRETSILFALGFASVLLKERLRFAGVAGATLVLSGLVVIRMA